MSGFYTVPAPAGGRHILDTEEISAFYVDSSRLDWHYRRKTKEKQLLTVLSN